MKISFRFVCAVLAVSLFLSACNRVESPINRTLDPTGSEAAEEFNEKFYGGLLASLVSGITDSCPIQDNEDIRIVIENMGLSGDSLVRLCEEYSSINTATISVVSLLALPSAMEPSLLGESTMGAIYSGGKIVAVVVLSVGVLATVGYNWAQLTAAQTSISEVVVSAPPFPGLPQSLEGINEIPSEAMEHLMRKGLDGVYAHHAWLEHAAVMGCITHIISTLGQNRIYFSAGAPLKGVTEPSLAFVWHLDKAIRDLTNLGNLGSCGTMSSDLTKEWGGEVIPFGNIKIYVIVGWDASQGRFYIASAYTVKSEVLNTQLCEWGYYWMVWPYLGKPVGCAAY